MINYADLFVLVVDDHAPTRALLGKGLEKIGFETILEASDGMEALNTMVKIKPDLILTDLEMDGMDGLDLIKMVRGDFRFQDCPIIVISSHSDPEFRKEVEHVGASGFLSKPVTMEKLKNAINDLLQDR